MWLASDWRMRVAAFRDRGDVGRPPPLAGSPEERLHAAMAGLPLVLRPLERHGAKAVVFLDMAELYEFGAAEFGQTIELAQVGGHDIQMHGHLEKLDHEWFIAHGLEGPPDAEVIDWPTSLAAAVIETMTRDFKSFVGRSPEAYRSGGYRSSDAIIDALVSNGFTLDASYDHLYRRNHSICRDRDVRLAPFHYRGLIELPVSTFASGGRTLRFEPWPTVTSGDRDIAALEDLHRSGERVISYIFHSYSFSRIEVHQGRRCWTDPDEAYLAWFERLLNFIDDHPGLRIIDSRQLLAAIERDPTILSSA